MDKPERRGENGPQMDIPDLTDLTLDVGGPPPPKHARRYPAEVRPPSSFQATAQTLTSMVDAFVAVAGMALSLPAHWAAGLREEGQRRRLLYPFASLVVAIALVPWVFAVGERLAGDRTAFAAAKDISTDLGAHVLLPALGVYLVARLVGWLGYRRSGDRRPVRLLADVAGVLGACVCLLGAIARGLSALVPALSAPAFGLPVWLLGAGGVALVWIARSALVTTNQLLIPLVAADPPRGEIRPHDSERRPQRRLRVRFGLASLLAFASVSVAALLMVPRLIPTHNLALESQISIREEGGALTLAATAVVNNNGNRTEHILGVGGVALEAAPCACPPDPTAPPNCPPATVPLAPGKDLVLAPGEAQSFALSEPVDRLRKPIGLPPNQRACVRLALRSREGAFIGGAWQERALGVRAAEPVATRNEVARPRRRASQGKALGGRFARRLPR
jgi:hypothetical protein